MKYLTILFLLAPMSVMSLAQEGSQSTASCKNLCKSAEACTSLITENIAMNWSRPPVKESQNMQVAVKISLLPNGTIKAASIETGSGHENLDKSVLQAVKRTSSFCEIQGVTPEVYEKNFKEFVIVFNTQDRRN